MIRMTKDFYFCGRLSLYFMIFLNIKNNNNNRLQSQMESFLNINHKLFKFRYFWALFFKQEGLTDTAR